MLDPEAAIPATEEVSKKTPPSELAFNVGKAFRRRCRLALQLTAQHWNSSQRYPARRALLQYLIPFSFTESVKVTEFREFSPALCMSDKIVVLQYLWSITSQGLERRTVEHTAFEMITSRPPNPSIASCTILSQSTSFPTS